MATNQARVIPSTTSTPHTTDMLSTSALPVMSAMTSRRFPEIPPTMSEDDRGLLLSCLAQISCIRMECAAEATTTTEGNIPNLHTLIDVPISEEVDNADQALASPTLLTHPTQSLTSQDDVRHIPSPDIPDISHTAQLDIAHRQDMSLPIISNTSDVNVSQASQLAIGHISSSDIQLPDIYQESQLGISDTSSSNIPLPVISHASPTATSSTDILTSTSEHQQTSTHTWHTLYPLTSMSHSSLSPPHELSDSHTATSYSPATVSHTSMSSLSMPNLSTTRMSSFQQPTLINTTTSSFQTPTTGPLFQQPSTSANQTSFQEPLIRDTTFTSYPRMTSFPQMTSSQAPMSAFLASSSLSLRPPFQQSNVESQFSQSTIGQPSGFAFQSIYPSTTVAQPLRDPDISSPLGSHYTATTTRAPSSTFPNPESNLPMMSPTSPEEDSRSESVESEALSDEDMALVSHAVVEFIERREHLSESPFSRPSTSEPPNVPSGQGHLAASWMQPGIMSSVPMQYPRHHHLTQLSMVDTRPEPGTTSQEGQPRLWKFIWDVLEDPRYNPSLITWVSRPEGIFRLTDPGRLAEFWGHVKGNRSMNYEKLSRGLRYYYTYNVLEHVPGKLVYKFGSGATQVMQCLEHSSPVFPVTSYFPPNTSS